MPISAGDFRKGVVFEMDGKPMLVVDFQHVKPGKGAAFVRTKYKNVMTGAIREESFNPSAKFEQVAVERKNAEYSYNDGDLYYFMDPETYDMTPLNKDVLGDGFQFVKENTMCTLVSYKGSVFSVEAPNFMELEVTATEPGVRGDTATNVHSGDRRHHQGASVHQRGREDSGGYPHRRVPGPREGISFEGGIITIILPLFPKLIF